MMNCSCPPHSVGLTLQAAQKTGTSDTKQLPDQAQGAVSPLREAVSEDTHDLLAGLSVKAPRSNIGSGQQPPTATTQPLTAKSAGLLSGNHFFLEALGEMKTDPIVTNILEEIGEKNPLLRGSLQRFLDSAGEENRPQFSTKVETSTAWLTDEKALFFKEHLFKTMHKHAKQPEMKLIAFEELQSEQAVKNRMLEALYKDDVTTATEICPPDLGKASKHRNRNTLVLELSEVTGQNADGSSKTGKPLRLFFASGEGCVPDTFFQRPTDQSSGSTNGYQALLDVCAGEMGESKYRNIYMNSDEFLKSASAIFSKNVELARNDGAILVLEFPMLKALGVLGVSDDRTVARVQDSPKKPDESSNGRTVDTEHMAMNFLLKMSAELGLNTPKADKTLPKYNLNVLSRYPICRSCHLGMAVAVTDDKFPRLNEFNIAYGPEPQKNEKNKTPAVGAAAEVEP